MNQTTLALRWRRTALWEAFNAAFLPAVALLSLGDRSGPATYVGLACVAGILLQGAGYFAWRTRYLGQPHPTRSGLRFFGLLRWVDPLILAAAVPAVAVIAQGAPDMLAGLLALMFATGEYINYFHWQLSVTNTREWHRLRQFRPVRPPLARDLRKNRTQPQRR